MPFANGTLATNGLKNTINTTLYLNNIHSLNFLSYDTVSEIYYDKFKLRLIVITKRFKKEVTFSYKRSEGIS